MKPKMNVIGDISSPNIFFTINDENTLNRQKLENAPKKIKKTRNSKIITKNIEIEAKEQPILNIILHLKCSINDLNDYNKKINKMVSAEFIYNPEIPTEIQTFDINENEKSKFTIYENNDNQTKYTQNNAYCENISTTKIYESMFICQKCEQHNIANSKNGNEEDKISLKNVNSKLKDLKINLYKNTIPDNKSACFWCTYEYDNQTCYIPKHELDGKLCGYGSFCRPECAVAFLMKENIDDSTKFERYHLLNNIYGKIYDFKKNIKPAPDPYYLLDKYYGNLSIQEYRRLLKTEHLLMVLEKPMTRILPELFEDNDNFISGIFGNNNNNATPKTPQNIYKVKRQSEKQTGPSKSSIIKEKFSGIQVPV